MGLITALLTIAFLVWFALELRQQNTVTTPMAKASLSMQTALNQSLAALRGWISYGEESFRAERREVWVTRIEPTLEALEALSGRADSTESAMQIAELRSALRKLKLVQWQIEDVAHTPGNNPALQLYESRLKPLRNKLISALDGATDAYRSTSSLPRDIEFLGSLMEFHSALLLSYWWLHDALVEGDELYRDNFTSLQAGLNSLANRIETEIDDHVEGDARQALHFALDEFAAASLLTQDILALQKASSSDVAERYFVERARPLVNRTRELTSLLVESQAAAREQRARKLTNRSYAITALAVLMGLLSAGSLSFSYRLKKQVANVLEKARLLGQYELDRQIGSGGMGEVYLGHHALMRRPTAIKLLSAITAQNLRAQQRFLNEVKLACQLSHPNTISVFDYGRTPAGIFYFAMEYIEGFCIDTLIKVAGPLPPGRAVFILQQACGSLQEAHEQNFLHRDVKPSNIMLSQLGGISDMVKVLDFGLAMDLAGEGEREHDTIAGTPMYLAPEVILSPETYSPRSDIYALGAVAYYMLCGEAVFNSADMKEILACQLEDEIPFPSERLGRALPNDLEQLVMRCLAKDPAQRPASVAQLATLLGECDCQPWTQVDAASWWRSYGEVTCHSAGPEVSKVSTAASGIEIMVDASRL